MIDVSTNADHTANQTGNCFILLKRFNSIELAKNYLIWNFCYVRVIYTEKIIYTEKLGYYGEPKVLQYFGMC